jgi:alkylhydroperoxidase/carboxymuconolactone decarboxylase family protein YurZ
MPQGQEINNRVDSARGLFQALQARGESRPVGDEADDASWTAIRSDYERLVGPWPPALDPVLEHDQEIARAYVRLAAVAHARDVLPARFRSLIMVAVCASTTHLHVPGIRHHMQAALGHGATFGQIREVLEMTSVIGMHTCTTGVPILFEELRALGQEPDMTLDPRQAAAKEEFVSRRGWWSDFLEQIVVLDPELLEAYVQYSTVPWKSDELTPKERELVYIAIDSQTTHLYAEGLRAHIRNALGHGATAAEIMAVFELISTLGVHTLTVGIPELARLQAAAGLTPGP